MQVESIAEFCNTFDLHCAIIGLNKTNIFFCLLLSGLLRQVYCIQLSLMGIQVEKLKKNNVPTYRPILVKQGQVRGNKNIFKVGQRKRTMKRSMMKLEIMRIVRQMKWMKITML